MAQLFAIKELVEQETNVVVEIKGKLNTDVFEPRTAT